jgi:hypothetical protein
MYDEEYKENLEASSKVDICKACPSAPECDRRDNTEPAILEMQFLHCHSEAKRADYKDDDYWVNKIVVEGV